ncbi:unnamed protein product [Amoebophrya sp. A25]|nr:unnamed protein product [Amoebophrya sp. A25]|eukprot:GSA25T00016359001.1
MLEGDIKGNPSVRRMYSCDALMKSNSQSVLRQDFAGIQLEQGGARFQSSQPASGQHSIPQPASPTTPLMQRCLVSSSTSTAPLVQQEQQRLVSSSSTSTAPLVQQQRLVVSSSVLPGALAVPIPVPSWQYSHNPLIMQHHSLASTSAYLHPPQSQAVLVAPQAQPQAHQTSPVHLVQPLQQVAERTSPTSSTPILKIGAGPYTFHAAQSASSQPVAPTSRVVGRSSPPPSPFIEYRSL